MVGSPDLQGRVDVGSDEGGPVVVAVSIAVDVQLAGQDTLPMPVLVLSPSSMLSLWLSESSVSRTGVGMEPVVTHYCYR